MAALCLLAAPPASASGIYLTWNDCGIGGAHNRSFACDSNDGADVLVASYVPPGGITKFVGLSSILQIESAQAVIPSWWQLEEGGCRSGLVSASYDFTTMSSCADYWAGRAMGGMKYYDAGEGPNRRRLWMVCAIADIYSAPISSSSEYYAFKITIKHTRSNGGGACTGCDSPVCISISSLELDQMAGFGDNILTGTGGSASVTWQGTGCSSTTRTGTWGKLKHNYR